METSTVLQKTNRIRIYEKTKLNNLVNHLFRNYKPETRQMKEDFNPDETKHNLVIGPDFQILEKGDDWFQQVEQEAKFFKENLEQSLIDADEIAEQKISLSRQQKDLTLKSIGYFAKLKNYDEQAESDLLPIITKCLDVKNQEKNNKDYSVIDQESLKTALEFYKNPPENIKIKGLNAKKKHLTQILETVDKMQVHNERRATASTRAVGFEDALFKIPKHNDKSIKDVDMIAIMKDWNDEYFKDFSILGGAFHKDERTKKGNEVDDHLHLIRSGFNKKTKRFDLPDHTHQLGLKLAKTQGVNFEPDGKKYNDTTENLRTVASEALQTEFYRFANERLEKLGYEFRFEKKALTPEEQELRAFLKEQSNLPKSQRVQNMHSYFKEQAELEIKKANNAKKKANQANVFIKKKKEELADIRQKRNNNVKIANDAIKKKNNIDTKINEAIKNFKEEQEEITEQQIDKITEQKLFFQKFTDRFFDYIEVIQRKNKNDMKFSYTDNLKQKRFFQTNIEAVEECKKSFPNDNEQDINKRIEKPFLSKLKDTLQNLFDKTFSESNSKYFDRQLNKVNSIIENSNKENAFDNKELKIRSRYRK